MIKEKLKLIKVALKEWHSTHAKNLMGKINSLKARLSDFDEKGAVNGLSAEEIDEMRGITHDIHFMSRVNTSISWQQSRLLLLKDGDVNSKYFHSVLSSRRRRIIPLCHSWSTVLLLKEFNQSARQFSPTSGTILRLQICIGRGLKI